MIPGSYILEELEAPDGYVRALPAAVEVNETKEIQRVVLSDEKTTAEIAETGQKAMFRISKTGRTARIKKTGRRSADHTVRSLSKEQNLRSLKRSV